MSNSNQDQNPNSNSNPRRHPRLQTSQSLFTITGHELVASPTNTDFAESSPNPDSADSHHITFPDFPAEGGRYAEFDMAGTMLSLGSDPSMKSFGSGSVFPTIPESHPGCMSQAARVQPMFPESDENGPRQMTRHGQPVRGIVQSMDMNTRSTARPGWRFGSVVLHDPPRSESAPPSIGAVTLRSPSSEPDPDPGSDAESPSTPLPPQVISTTGSRE